MARLSLVERNTFQEGLTLAREYRGLSQTELAKKSGVARQQIVNLESGVTLHPTDTTRDALCASLDVFREFMEIIPDESPSERVLHFRGKPRVTARINRQLVAQGSVWIRFTRAVESRVRRLPEDGFSKIANTGSIEDVAARTRKAWGLREDAPLKNVTRLLERAGAFVGTFEGGEDGIDAYSWQGASHYILGNADREMPSRTRHSRLHEAGHLILHRGRQTGDPATEEEAHRFAGAMLLPRRAFWQEFPRGSRLNWDGMFRMKERWGTSVQAIVRRAYDLTLIDAAQYKRAFIYISSMGWRKREPNEASEVEQPELLPRVLESLAQSKGVTPSELGRSIGLPVSTLSKLVGTDLSTLDAMRTVVNIKAPKA